MLSNNALFFAFNEYFFNFAGDFNNFIIESTYSSLLLHNLPHVSSTIDGNPPTLLTIAGIPNDKASNAAKPYPSQSDVNRKILERASYL